ncbi:MAG: benzoate-CoA ligase family protein [Nitriliruptorales bacterium]
MTVEIPERINASTLLDANLEAGRGDKVAIHFEDQEVTYAELFARACQVANLLRALGVGREQRVLVSLHDTPWFPAVLLGAIRAGAVPVPLNTFYRARDYRYFLDDTYATLAVVEAALVDQLLPAVAESPLPVRVLVANGTHDGLESLEDLLADQPGECDPLDTHRDDPAFWLYSSGSTGTAKGIVHLQHDILVTCETYARHVLGLTADDVTFSATKAYHAYGLGNSISFPYWAGATTVLHAGPPTPDAVLDLVRRHRPTLFYGVPTLFNAILNHKDTKDEDFADMRALPSAAEPLPPEVFRRWKDRFGTTILDGIGSTELLHIYCSNRLDDVQPGTSGLPVPGYELKILDEAGQPVPEGEAGDLYVKGESCFAFYWHKLEKTAATLKGEWFFSGDRYRVDDEGYYVYEGRADDMIKVSGLWVSPIEIENVLMEHEAVSEAAAVGIPVEGFTKIKAHVIVREGVEGSDELKEELVAWCKDQLQRYQFPQYVEFVDDFPRTPTGKIRRFLLRERGVGG